MVLTCASRVIAYCISESQSKCGEVCIYDNMSRGDAEKLSAPARKIFVEQLQNCSRQKDPIVTSVTKTDLNLDQRNCWLLEAIPGKPDMTVLLEIVWLQGTVLESNPEWIVIHDGTGKVRGELHDVKKANKIMTGDKVVSKGAYVILVGTILSIGEMPVIRAVKCSELEDPDIHRELWQSEVLHQQRFMSG